MLMSFQLFLMDLDKLMPEPQQETTHQDLLLDQFKLEMKLKKEVKFKLVTLETIFLMLMEQVLILADQAQFHTFIH